MTLLDEALEAWGFAREGVIEEIENLSDRDMGFRPADESRTVAELVAHILESGAMMAGSSRARTRTSGARATRRC